MEDLIGHLKAVRVTLTVEDGVKALGVGEPLATIPIRLCWGVRLCKPLGDKAPEELAYPYDGCGGNFARSLCPERDKRIPSPYF
ncbi:hypothetical protein E2C01_042367 [Portunus trituberculatus]|uniref:Uncharacterized protein n=1 Tax=Portunus trituberculatus TaxID=210409 RepID=A0A5B7FMA0_PORTR|nr:hypothetical protein [Portunus trituberculatus]